MTEQDALRQLVTCDGWRLLLQHAKAEWGAVTYVQRIKQAVATVGSDATLLSQTVLQWDYAADQVNLLLSWPDERLKAYAADAARDGEAAVVDLSRRGTL